MRQSPISLNLPPDSHTIDDVDEEIFLLYTRKNQSTGAQSTTPGLGFIDSKSGSVSISLNIVEPLLPFELESSISKDKGKKKKSRGREVNVEFVIQQDLAALRNRKGDTGSVIWRISPPLARHFLLAHHFPSPDIPPLFPTWSTSTILELGSGTGYLGLALASTVKRWRFSDQASSLPLMLKNLKSNGVEDPEVEEIDWDVESEEFGPSSGRRRKEEEGEEGVEFPDIILAADCIFNAAHCLPLARTITHLAGPETIALVASDIRAQEPLEIFLASWLELGWKIVRYVLGERDELGGSEFVVWIGWREI